MLQYDVLWKERNCYSMMSYGRNVIMLQHSVLWKERNCYSMVSERGKRNLLTQFLFTERQSVF
jgi:hypothetical protein